MTGRLVLFGSRGFIGSAIRRHMGSEVAAPSRSELDLRDEARLRAFLCPGDVVINAAGFASATDRSPAGLARMRADNVDAVRALRDAGEAVGIGQLIHLSSVAAMGHREGHELTEDNLAPPRSPYGQSKRHAECLLEAGGRVPVTVLRPTSIFGEGRPLATLLCRAAALPLVPLPRAGTALVPFCHVDNVAAAVILAIARPACFNRTFIVGDATSYPLVGIVRALAANLGRKGRIVPVPLAALLAAGRLESAARRLVGGAPILDPVRLATLSCTVSYSIAAFQAATGYQPPVGLDEAAERIAAWHRGRRS